MPVSAPNVLLINCHDLGQYLGCYGVPTVNSQAIDGLAGGGVRLAKSFCSAPQCSPSRASICTGRYGHSNGVMGLTHDLFAWDLHPQERHIAGILRDAGFRSVLVGVQHETRRPGQMGFDEILHVGQGNHSDRIAQRAAEVMAALKDRRTPFYMQVGFFDPHRVAVTPQTPHAFRGHDDSRGVTVPPYLVDEPSARAELGAFQGAIRLLDQAVGQILGRLEELGLADNTLVIFTTDHGIPFPRAKCSLYDGGLEVASIWRWPEGGIAGGRTCQDLVSNVDYVPTICELLGIVAPENVQGLSFAPALLGRPSRPRQEIFGEMTYHDYCDPRRCVRTLSHKLIVNFTMAPFFMDPSQEHRPRTITRQPAEPKRAYHPVVELYDLQADPLEQNNLADCPQHADICRDLLGRLRNWMVQTADPLLDGIPISPLHRMALASLDTGRLTRETTVSP